ncbi:cellulose synthase-like protein G3 isoform X1 [Prunus yedoensis var. nudiflora]|uniref:Cellulose synthase-like protein G3 isoform X1 n=1 Tax=Prunus yedoensis var. nudiflora TaxID=2094558 RepID=A0A314Y6W3_PRUYE|nr:cellulose synthase-like protein G3 isoform X1 [Prunus yedoensis var. nudiflora]
MSSNTHGLPLHTHKPSRRTTANRIFAVVYGCATLALISHHALSLLNSTTLTSFFISLTFLISDSILAFMFATTQSFHMRPIYRKEFPENLKRVVEESDFPALDVFISTADPYKEPPMNVVNTALSVMAYDYPIQKVSVYISDDGGSALTLFALMEAAKFARHWLPFCRNNNKVDCSPEAYFAIDRDSHLSDQVENIKVLLESNKDKDITGNLMPNLIYVSREKSKTSTHHFKAGALNVLLRVSAIMTNAPIILTLDCDMHSNDPQTAHRALCYILDPEVRPKLGYIQFPQLFRGINKNDIYACEHKRLFQIDPMGMNGLSGSNHLGTGCFFTRRAFFGGPSNFLPPEIPQLSPNNLVDKHIWSSEVMELAYCVAACNYENNTNWGLKMGVRYGSLVEDYFTGYRLQCEGWKSIFCHPDRAAFYGDIPINLVEVLNQNKRWAIGLLEVAFSKFSPITFGTRAMGPLMGLAYAHSGFWPIWSILILVCLPPPANSPQWSHYLPKVSEPWFLLYVYLFLGAYIQDFLDFVLAGGTFYRWWNDQRMWIIRGLSSYLFGLIEFLLKYSGISTHGFNLTSKVLDEDQRKRYEQGTMEFGVPSPLFVP